MKPVIVLLASFISACAGSAAEPSTVPAGPSFVADSCAVARPDFGAVATEADRKLFAYDVNAPLNLQKTVESTKNGVEVSAISFGSPDGGPVTGLSFDPVTRSSLRPGIVLMHGMPGTAHGPTSTMSASPTLASVTAARWARCSSASNGVWKPRCS